MVWDGKERRRDNLIEFQTLNDEVDGLRVSQARLDEKVTGFLETTTEYRRSLCAKLDKINDKLDLVIVHETRLGGMDKQLIGMWAVIGVVFFAIVAAGVKMILGV